MARCANLFQCGYVQYASDASVSAEPIRNARILPESFKISLRGSVPDCSGGLARQYASPASTGRQEAYQLL